jgi:asparagine synthase (glutamine-hydrolysing)
MLGALKRRGIARADFIDYIGGDGLHQHPAYYGVMVWVLMMLEGWFEQHAEGSMP